MSKHTPGPWHRDEEYPIYVWGPNQEMVADLPSCDEDAYLARMRGVGRGATREEQAANCSLIAAAPDLLDACRRVLALMDDPLSDDWGKSGDVLRAAIEKAEGL